MPAIWLILLCGADAPAPPSWSTGRLERPVVPASQVGRNPIDAFLESKRAAKNLTANPEADRRTLVLRLYLNLTGLPPTAEEAKAFIESTDPAIDQKTVERLLASRAHAEHWARHWLDVARYSDSKGYAFLEERTLPFAWTYRDWVVNALADDMPFDRFVRLQLAADLLPDARPADKAALGFLTLGRRFLNNEPDILDDRIDVVSRGLLGMTVSCARCHDHKYDPITMRDYYGLYSIFANSPEAKEMPRLSEAPLDDEAQDFAKEQARRDKIVKDFIRERMKLRRQSFRTESEVKRYLLAAHASPGEVTKIASEGEFNPFVWQRWKDYLDGKTESDRVLGPWRQLDRIEADLFEAQAKRVAQSLIPGNFHPAVVALFATPPKTRDELAGRYAELLSRSIQGTRIDPDLEKVLMGTDSPVNVSDEMPGKLFGRSDRDQQRELQRQADEWRAATPANLACAMALKDRGTPMPQKLMRRGNPNLLGEVVPARLPTFLGGCDEHPFSQGSGRKELAEALMSGKARDLMARVIVNRVWAWHFGEGLSRTPSDFGARGDAPTHPELLDWLASEFVEHGFSLRHLHRLIVTSQAYRQSTASKAKQDELDPENRFLARQNRRRLDFESLRDRMLFAAGSLDAAGSGPADAMFTTPFPTRRTLYGYVDRQNLPSVWLALDGPNPDSHLAKRTTTLTPAQGLFWLNHPLVIEMARRASDRTFGQKDRICGVYRAVLGREPTAEERAISAELIKTIPESSRVVDSNGKAPPPTWTFGYGTRTDDECYAFFMPFSCFTGDSWQATPLLPRPGTGKMQITAEGGHPGPGNKIVVVRQFRVPADGKLKIEGTVQHPDYRGDGVFATIRSDKQGFLWRGAVHNGSKEHRVEIEAKAGELIDFAVDCRKDPGYDFFFWSPVIHHDKLGDFSATAGFTGPEPARLQPTGLLAQTLMWTTEFQWIP